MTNSIAELRDADTILVIGSNTTECHPVIGILLRQAAVAGTKIVVADPRKIDLTRHAVLHLQHRPGTDAALIDGLIREILAQGLEDREFIAGRTERFDDLKTSIEPYTPEKVEEITGVPAADLRTAARIYGEAGAASICYAMGITQHVAGTDNVKALANLAMVTGNVGKPSTGVNPLRGQNNVQGACDLGGLPNVYPGYQKVTDKALRKKFEKAWGRALSPTVGLTVTEAIAKAHTGELKALYVLGEDPALSDPNSTHVREALEKLELLVVQEIFPTESSNYAHVILPGVSFAEKDGTVTNTERRVRRTRKAVEPPGEAREDTRILLDLAARLGLPMDYAGPADIFDEIASLTPSYGGMSYARLEGEGLQWPCPTPDHPGTPYLHKDVFASGKGLFHAIPYAPPPERPDDEYPYTLSTGRMLYHFHTGNMTRRSAGLDAHVPEGAVEIHPRDAETLGLAQGDWVKVSSRRGTVRVKAEVSEKPSPGMVFMTFHFKEAAANLLTIDAFDPVAKIPEFKVCAVRLEKMAPPTEEDAADNRALSSA